MKTDKRNIEEEERTGEKFSTPLFPDRPDDEPYDIEKLIAKYPPGTFKNGKLVLD